MFSTSGRDVFAGYSRLNTWLPCGPVTTTRNLSPNGPALLLTVKVSVPSGVHKPFASRLGGTEVAVGVKVGVGVAARHSTVKDELVSCGM